MKPFAKRFLALASAAAITLTTIPAIRGIEMDRKDTAMTISERSTQDAQLRTAQVRTASVPASFTRQDLCGMVMNTYKTLSGLTDVDLGEPAQMFTDTADLDVLNAYHLDLVTAKSAGIFAPDETVTRQDFFTVAVQLLDTLGYTYINDISMDLEVYADADEIMAYAKQPVQVLMCIGALEEESLLEPNRPVTAAEAQALLDRVADYYTQWLEDPVSPQRYLGEEVAEFALNYVGCRYVRGCRGPNKFDCSGLVYYVYKNFGYTIEPSGRNQWSVISGTVKKADLLPGDVLFFSNNGRSSGIFHVGIYIGDGQFVHAANSRKGVIVSGLDETWYANRYLGAKRPIG